MYPKLKDLRVLERHTLQTISEMNEFVEFPDLYNTAQRYRLLIREDRGDVNIHVGFLLDIRLRADNHNMPMKRRVDIGALVTAASNGRDIKQASYSVTICLKDNPKTSPIVRKLHFDFEPVTSRNQAEPKPSVHMQVCGKLSPYHTKAGYPTTALNQWYPNFEKPRIPIMPMSLALLLNWLMLEFQTDKTARAIISNSRWRKLVAEAERTALRPYYKAAHDFLNLQRYAGMPFTEHHLYEIPSS